MDADYRRRTGRIFDIQKYSIHDGPGIRTIVFLQGLRPCAASGAATPSPSRMRSRR